MSRRRNPLSTALRRATIGLALVAASLFVAPVASATPETEANDAITAAYDASGGPGGPLGERDGGAYPVGTGFGANFANGKMFFTPATGAHFMQGAILEKYESLGGAADGDLGFPTIDEGQGRVGPDSRNTTFSAADRPVIFWTPDTGARVVRGAVNAAWDRLGGSSGPLGVPAEDEMFRGDVVSQRFTGGELTWNRVTDEFTTVPPELAGQLADLQVPEDPASAINAARRAAGGALGPLGARDGESYQIGEDGLGQNFAGGKIFYSPATGAHVVTGQVLDKYESVGGPEGDLGFPTSSESDGGFGADSAVTTFAAADNPAIFWTPDYGAVIVRGAMRTAWDELDGAAGPMGAPMADQSDDGNVITQRFSGGAISFDRTTNDFTTEPTNLASQLSGLQVPGQDVPPAAPPTPQAADGDGDGTELSWKWNWWWLLAIVPVLIVAGLVFGAVWWNRRRGRQDDRRFDDGEFAALGAARYGDSPAADRHDGAQEEQTSPFGFAGQGLQTPAGDSHRDLVAAGVFEEQEDPDSIDTAPTRIVTGDVDQERVEPEPVEPEVVEPESVQHEPEVVEPEVVAPEVVAVPPWDADDAPSGRHAAIDIDEPTPGQTALHLPLEDPHEAPEGYLIKADTRSGLYWSPDSERYDEVVAEIWFSSEEFARTNGFVRAD